MKKIFLLLVYTLIVSGIFAQNAPQPDPAQAEEIKDLKQQVVKLKGSNAVLSKRIEDLKSTEHMNNESLNKLITENTNEIKVAADSLYANNSMYLNHKDRTNKRFHEAKLLLIALFIIMLLVIAVIIMMYMGNNKKVQLLKEHIEKLEAAHDIKIKDLTDSISSVKSELKGEIANLQRSINKS